MENFAGSPAMILDVKAQVDCFSLTSSSCWAMFCSRVMYSTTLLLGSIFTFRNFWIKMPRLYEDFRSCNSDKFIHIPWSVLHVTIEFMIWSDRAAPLPLPLFFWTYLIRRGCQFSSVSSFPPGETDFFIISMAQSANSCDSKTFEIWNFHPPKFAPSNSEYWTPSNDIFFCTRDGGWNWLLRKGDTSTRTNEHVWIKFYLSKKHFYSLMKHCLGP